MARGRFISRTISLSEQLSRVSWQADLLFTKMIPHLDVEGRIRAHPALLKATVVPLRKEITEEMIPGLLQELRNAVGTEGQGLIVWYEVNGMQLAYCPGFVRHNTVSRKKEAPSMLPPPPVELPMQNGLFQEVGPIGVQNSGLTPDPLPTDDGPTPPKEKVSKEKRSKENGAQFGAEFGTLWLAYPKRSGANSRKAALEKFTARRREGVSFDELHEATLAYASYCKASGNVGSEFVMRAETFYGRNERWKEDWTTLAAQAKNGGKHNGGRPRGSTVGDFTEADMVNEQAAERGRRWAGPDDE